MKNVMVDLETLGNGSNAVIIAIGAVEFDTESGLGRVFYANIDPQSCVNAGLVMDVSTVMWWMKQSDQARAAFDKPSTTLTEALKAFFEWYPEDANMWGNGATFDNVILSNAYKATGLNRPWPYWADRCYRTLKALHPDIAAARTGTHHNALDDATTQATHAIQILKAMKGTQ